MSEITGWLKGARTCFQVYAWRWLRFPLLAIGLMLTAVLLLLLFPQPLFAHSVRAGSIVLHSPQPLPMQAQAIAAQVQQRVERSPFYAKEQTYDVYLCDTPRLFALVSVKHPHAGGVSQVYLSGNAFVRPSHIQRDRVVAANGEEVPGVRTLTYHIAHEVTHSMLARHIGRRAYHKLAAWQQEGYADYVAKAPGEFNFEAAREALRRGDAELLPGSRLYLKYHVLIAYYLDVLGNTPQDLLAAPRASAPLEAALRR